MVDGEDQLLHAVRVLHDVAVVLGAGADALPGGVLGHLADGILRAGDDLAPVEVAPPGHVVADDLRAQMLGHVDLGLELGNHVGVFDEIRPDGVGDDGQADGFAVGANFVGQRAQIRRGLILRIEIDELDAVEADFPGQIAQLQIAGVGVALIMRKAVAADADFHFFAS